jgi:hydroxyacylglutathione hydrolase
MNAAMDSLEVGEIADIAGAAPRVILIEVSRHAMKNNNYLVVDPDGGDAVLVDPAWEADKIQAAVAQAGARPRGILVTHAHPDHTDLAEPLARFYGCPVWMSRHEIQASGFAAPQLVPIDETPWSVGRLGIRPIWTPGHTPGCVCYLIGQHLFTGDVLFPEGCGLCPGEAAAHDMFDSLERLKSRLDPHTQIYPGHTYVRPPGRRFSDVLKHNMYLQFTDKHSFAAFRLRKGQSAAKWFDFR